MSKRRNKSTKNKPSGKRPAPAPVTASPSRIPVPAHPVQFEVVLGRLEEKTRKEIIGLWTTVAEMPEAEALRRVTEVVVVARREPGLPAGVSTAFPVQIPGLGACWALRMFIAPSHRGWTGRHGAGMAHGLFRATFEALREPSLSMPEGGPKGAVIVLENPKFRSARWKRVFEGLGWKHVGTAPNGCPALFRAFA